MLLAFPIEVENTPQVKTVISFVINENEFKEAEQWKSEHECKTQKKEKKLNNKVAIPVSCFSYKFTPTSMGHLVSICCKCGAEKDVTDVGCW